MKIKYITYFTNGKRYTVGIRTSSLQAYIYLHPSTPLKYHWNVFQEKKKYTLKYRHSCMELTGENTVTCRKLPPFFFRKSLRVNTPALTQKKQLTPFILYRWYSYFKID